MDEYILYCDESVQNGKHYSNFYGGALVRSKDLNDIIAVLEDKKTALNCHKELKWQKITTNYKNKYIDLIECVFDLVAQGKIKIRIMFTHNAYIPKGLTKEQRNNEYFLLYYQFIKHAFGLDYSHEGVPKRLRIYCDELPDSTEKCERFKSYIAALNSNKQWQDAGIKIAGEQIAEVSSHKHVIMQCLDIILGAMAFRLNDLHKAKPKDQHFRGNRTIAKEKVYKAIHKRITALYPNFNIGETTGIRGRAKNRWEDPYRHWKFIPNNYNYDKRCGKRYKPKA